MPKPSVFSIAGDPQLIANIGLVTHAGGGTDVSGMDDDYIADPWVNDPDNPGQQIRQSQLTARRQAQMNPFQSLLQNATNQAKTAATVGQATPTQAAPLPTFSVGAAAGQPIAQTQAPAGLVSDQDLALQNAWHAPAPSLLDKTASLVTQLPKVLSGIPSALAVQQKAEQATQIPGITPFIRNTVQPTAANALQAIFPENKLLDLVRSGTSQQLAKLGASQVPATGFDAALAASPLLGKAADALRGAGAAEDLTGAALGAGIPGNNFERNLSDQLAASLQARGIEPPVEEAASAKTAEPPVTTPAPAAATPDEIRQAVAEALRTKQPQGPIAPGEQNDFLNTDQARIEGLAPKPPGPALNLYDQNPAFVQKGTLQGALQSIESLPEGNYTKAQLADILRNEIKPMTPEEATQGMNLQPEGATPAAAGGGAGEPPQPPITGGTGWDAEGHANNPNAFPKQQSGYVTPSAQANIPTTFDKAMNQIVGAIRQPIRFSTFGLHNMRIGVGEALTHPPEALQALKDQANLFLHPENLPVIQQRLNSLPYIGGDAPIGTRWMDFTQSAGKQLPTPLAEKLVDNIPGVGPLLKRNQNAVFGYLESLQKQVYNSEAQRLGALDEAAQKAGEPGLDSKMYQDAYDAVRHAGGSGTGSNQLASTLGYSPSAMLSRFKAYADVFNKSGSPLPWDAGARSIAVRNLLAIGGLVTAANGLGQLTGAKLSIPGVTDSLTNAFGINSKIGKVAYGTTSQDWSAGYGPVLRLFGNLANDVANRDQKSLESHISDFARGQLGPVPGNAVSLFTGTDWQGKPFGPKNLLDLKTQADIWAPIAANSIWQAATTPGGNVLASLPSLGAVSTATSASTSEQRDNLAQQLYQEQYSKLSPMRQAEINGKLANSGQYVSDASRRAPWWTARDAAIQKLGQTDSRLQPFDDYQEWQDYWESRWKQEGVAKADWANKLTQVDKAYGITDYMQQIRDLVAQQDPGIIPALENGGYSVPKHTKNAVGTTP